MNQNHDLSSLSFYEPNFGIPKLGERNPVLLQKKRSNLRRLLETQDIKTMDIILLCVAVQGLKLQLQDHVVPILQYHIHYRLHRHIQQILMHPKADCPGYFHLEDLLAQVINSNFTSFCYD